MAIDWEKEIAHRSDEMINDLSELVSINSQRDVEHKTDEYPLGPGPAKALKIFLNFAKRDGFETKNVDNLAGRIEYGEGEAVGILAHVDVVPEGPGWETDPFKPVIKDGKLYARGSSDDKGPSLGAYYALKVIKEMKLPVSKKVQLILGTDEENDWTGINHYMKTEEMPEVGFSPDAQFPAINGEKGIVSFDVQFPNPSSGLVKSFESGIVANMVPQNADAVIDLTDIKVEELQDLFDQFLTGHKEIKGSIDLTDNEATIHIVGKGAHAMQPAVGINAATYLASFLTKLNLNDRQREYFQFIAESLHLDFAGKALGIANTHEVMGELTVSPNIFKFDEDNASILLNIRYPKGDDGQSLTDKINKHLPKKVTATIKGHNQLPHFVPADDPLVKTLLSAYKDHTGDDSPAYTVGGGTYGRILKKGVAFGAMFPNDENVMHQPNEYIDLEKLQKATAIYADAIYRLIK
ncbi:dipeptidase PepV [Companilactobacillus tucceti DSM 20183]|uniref:Dipeptidase PepV n=1 Tax=Companilactobacillus tucceti DSM 20183 TaxID=1423811 RepID=A0A0R1IXT8_9LACO|nr:dipeptidase PepV [Companilactobacillus tucceti]KRK64085.1 dipeptidase PepV [Companilactobacillus tucceti DSM 20183]